MFANFSFAENRGTGMLGDLYIGLGNYYDLLSGTLRKSNYSFDITGQGLTVVGSSQTGVVLPPIISKSFGSAVAIPVGYTAALTFTISNPNVVQTSRPSASQIRCRLVF